MRSERLFKGVQLGANPGSPERKCFSSRRLTSTLEILQSNSLLGIQARLQQELEEERSASVKLQALLESVAKEHANKLNSVIEKETIEKQQLKANIDELVLVE